MSEERHHVFLVFFMTAYDTVDYCR